MDITPEQVLRIALQTARNQERFSPETIRRLRQANLVILDPWTDELESYLLTFY